MFILFAKRTTCTNFCAESVPLVRTFCGSSVPLVRTFLIFAVSYAQAKETRDCSSFAGLKRGSELARVNVVGRLLWGELVGVGVYYQLGVGQVQIEFIINFPDGGKVHF